MSVIKHITSRDNPFYKYLLKLATSSRARHKAGQTLLDGPHLLRAWLDADRRPSHLVLNESAWGNPEIRELLIRCADVPRIFLDDNLFGRLSELKTPNGLLALVNIPRPREQEADFILLLEDIQDPGNLGTILRSAAAAGCDAVFLSAGCADAWSPKVLRAGMGGHNSIIINEKANLVEIASKFNGHLFAASLEAKTTLYDCDLRGKVAFAIGNEGAGLSQRLLEKAHRRFLIPMAGKVESLNAAVAAAICLFEAVRQRRFSV